MFNTLQKLNIREHYSCSVPSNESSNKRVTNKFQIDEIKSRICMSKNVASYRFSHILRKISILPLSAQLT